ncbi:hypothetical protein ACOMHN_021073 [Nucella lapillus]
MCGDFLRGVCHELGPRFDIASDLDISKPEVETVMADPLLTSEEEKMFKVSGECREIVQTIPDYFREVWKEVFGCDNGFHSS